VACDYLVGPEGIEASKWRSTEWLRKKHLPPLISSNISESSNALYEEARKLPWLYCIDTILNTMSTSISTLREKNRDRVGVVPEFVGILENRWNDSEKHHIIQLEDGGGIHTELPVRKLTHFKQCTYLMQRNRLVHVECGRSMDIHAFMLWYIIGKLKRNH
jgi:hypothetical protein